MLRRIVFRTTTTETPKRSVSCLGVYRVCRVYRVCAVDRLRRVCGVLLFIGFTVFIGFIVLLGLQGFKGFRVHLENPDPQKCRRPLRRPGGSRGRSRAASGQILTGSGVWVFRV